MRRQKGPRTWVEVYRELSAIDKLAQEILAGWEERIEEAILRASCCITIAEILRDFRARAWHRAVRAYERGERAQSSLQLQLFR